MSRIMAEIRALTTSKVLTFYIINSIVISILIASSSVQSLKLSPIIEEGHNKNDPERDSKSEGYVRLGKNRKRRNVGQLLSLLVNTPYSFIKLANYGNWCGKGGDAMGDGSYVDGCDLCCKLHDLCYYKTRHEFPGCSPWYKMYSYTFQEEEEKNEIDSTTFSELGLGRIRSIPKLNPRLTAQQPSCLSKENQAPSCQQSTCQCDVNFTLCLMKEPCPPERVRKDGALWWLPV